MIITDTTPIEIIASEGMILTNGHVYTDRVYLGIYDSPDNWCEIPESAAEAEPEVEDLEDLAEAARILLGMR